MNSTTFYIALGSNKGDKIKHLQNAVDMIYLHIGAIKLISKVYKSPSFGFESDDFLNCCLVLETDLKPQNVLDILLDIETALGRTRTQKNTYEARTIDLDIVFAGDLIIETETLQVPHPEMGKRKFVLLPLNDVASKMINPKLNKAVAVLLADCEDASVLEPINIWLKNPARKTDFSKFNHIAIEGNIGAGKTSLASRVAQDFSGRLVLERFADNPFYLSFMKTPGAMLLL